MGNGRFWSIGLLLKIGAILLLVSSIILILTISPYLLETGLLPQSNAELVAYGILEFVLSIALFSAAFKVSKAEEGAQKASLSKWMLVLSLAAILLFLVLPWVVLTGTTVIGSILSAGASAPATTFNLFLINYNTFANPSNYNVSQLLSIVVLPYAEQALVLLGLLILFVGSAYLLSRQNRGYAVKVIATFIILLIIMAIASQYFVSYDNSIALKSLNAKINTYGAYSREMLSNYTLFNSSTGMNRSIYIQELGFSSNITNIGNALFNQSLNAQETQQVGASPASAVANEDLDFNTYFGWQQGLVFYTLYSLGIPVLNQSRPGTFLVPKENALTGYYTLEQQGFDTLSIALELGSIFNQHLFNINITGIAPKALSVAFMPSPLSGSVAVTTSIGYSPYLEVAEFPLGWVVLVPVPYPRLASLGTANYSYDITNYTTNQTRILSRSFNATSVFYSLALLQYEGYADSELLYNVTIPPSIFLVDYTDNSLLINLGNLNPSYSGALVYVDGKELHYTRYFNYLSSNVTLGVGLHNLTVDLPEYNLTMTQAFYVSPYLFVVSTMGHGCNTCVPAMYSKLYLTITNPGTTPITVSNITVSATPPGFDSQSAYNSTNPQPDSQSIGSFNLSRSRDNVSLNYTFGKYGAPIGTPFIYYLSIDTNYGKAYYVLIGKAV